MIKTKSEAAEWRTELKAHTCTTLLLGYCGKQAANGLYHVDLALRVSDAALGASLLELVRNEPLIKRQVTTMYNPLLVLALDDTGRPVAAFTMTDGSMQPIRVGRFHGRWVWNEWFMCPVSHLRMRNQGIEKLLRNKVEESGVLKD